MLAEAEKPWLTTPGRMCVLLEEGSALAIWCWTLQEIHSFSVCALIMDLPTYNLQLCDAVLLCCLFWLSETAFFFSSTFYATLMLLYTSLLIDF